MRPGRHRFAVIPRPLIPPEFLPPSALDAMAAPGAVRAVLLTLVWRVVLGLALTIALTLLGTFAHAATITIVNLDGPCEGFNDTTPAVPVGGNPGTTIGAQRPFVFQCAATRWDGRDLAGRTVPAGVYQYMLRTPSYEESNTVVVVG